MKRSFLRLRQETGSTAVEYAIMVALIVGLVIVGAAFLGQTLNLTF